jgi:N-acetylmuramoyl-L-alanine amidase
MDRKVFVVNFGHGEKNAGYDPGAVGRVKWLKEAEQTKQIGEIFASGLEADGHTVRTIQDGDLEDIANFTNQVNPDLFISIHCNSSAEPSAHGIETYALQPGGFGETAARAIQNELVKELGLTDRGVKFSKFYVLRKTNCPAVLAEIGFISNVTEEGLMMSPDFDKRAAKALQAGVYKAYGFNTPDEKPKTYGVWYQGEDDKGGANRVALMVKGTPLPRKSYSKGMYDINIMVGGKPVNAPNHVNLTGEDWIGTMELVLDFLEGRIKV